MKKPTKLLILYNFAEEEENITAPNFYKAFAEKVLPNHNFTVYFLPPYKHSFLYNLALKFHCSKNIAKRIRYIFWYLVNLHKYEIIIGWLDLGILASLVNYLNFKRRRKLFLILYYINKNNLEKRFFYKKIFFLVSEGTYKLIFLDSAQANGFGKSLKRSCNSTVSLRYGVESSWYARYHAPTFIIKENFIFSPGGAHRNDNILFKAFFNLNFLVRRFQVTDSNIPEIECRKVGRSLFEFYSNIEYDDYINYCLRAKYVVISVDNGDKPVGLTSLLECMSLGKTIFISKGLSTNDYIVDNVTGILFEDEDDLVVKILELESSPEKSRYIGLNALNAARTVFDLKFTGKQFVDLITDN